MATQNHTNEPNLNSWIQIPSLYKFKIQITIFRSRTLILYHLQCTPQKKGLQFLYLISSFISPYVTFQRNVM